MSFLHSMLEKIPALIIIGAFGVSMLLVSATPRPAEAQFPVSDGISYVSMAISHVSQEVQVFLAGSIQAKEYIGDPLAWILSKSALRSATKKIINMTSKGYTDSNGNKSSVFVTNLSKNLRDAVGTPVAKKVIKNVNGAKKTTSPFAASASRQVRDNYYRNSTTKGFWSTHHYTLDKSVPNTTKFLNGDFSQGGVNGFLSMTTNPLNNPYGTYFAAQNHLNKKVSSARSARKTELTYGGGALSSPGKPGSVIKAQLDKALGSGIDSNIAADEISETIGGLATNLVTNALGGAGGLGGFTKPSTNGNTNANSYAAQKPSQKSIIGIARGLTGEINRNEKVLNTYISNWSTILSPTQKAHDSLDALISYTPPKNIMVSPTFSTNRGSSSHLKYYPSEYSVCVKDFKSLQPVASASQASVQKILNRGNTAIRNANSALVKFKAIRKEIKHALTTKTLADITKSENDYQTLTSVSSGLMPSTADTEYAGIQSSQGVGASTSNNGLTVTGGTVSSQMPLLSSNAIRALSKTKTCFVNSLS